MEDCGISVDLRPVLCGKCGFKCLMALLRYASDHHNAKRCREDGEDAYRLGTAAEGGEGVVIA